VRKGFRPPGRRIHPVDGLTTRPAHALARPTPARGARASPPALLVARMPRGVSSAGTSTPRVPSSVVNHLAASAGEALTRLPMHGRRGPAEPCPQPCPRLSKSDLRGAAVRRANLAYLSQIWPQSAPIIIRVSGFESLLRHRRSPARRGCGWVSDDCGAAILRPSDHCARGQLTSNRASPAGVATSIQCAVGGIAGLKVASPCVGLPPAVKPVNA